MTKKKILIADDDNDILEVTGIILEGYGGYEIEVVNRGEALLELCEPFPDLILLDLWLSGHHGKDICRRLKADNATSHIPVIIFSANRELRQIASSCGADDFLAKPFQMDELLAKVGEWVG